jgi:ribokinase
MAVIGATNWDVSIFERRFPLPGEEVPVTQVKEFSGGKGANVAVAAARILGKGRVGLLSTLGDDRVSDVQLRALREEGVLTSGVLVVKGSTSGRAYVVVDSEGRKTIHTLFGANEELTPGHLTGHGMKGVLSRASLVVVMDSPVRVARAAAEMCAARGAGVIYSPGVRSGAGFEGLDGVILSAQTVVVDSSELRALAGTEKPAAAVERFRRRFPRVTLVATLGKEGCVVADGKGTTRVPGVTLSDLGMRAVNSTGSGDAFLGVYASCVMMGLTPAKAVPWANLAGALKATKYETRGSPTAKELQSSMRALEAFRRLPRDLRARRAS